jgi:predicted Mrr-cat superfamily restriction endonuclease
MSVWILQQLLSPKEEVAIEQRARLLLPFDGVPDLSFVASAGELAKMLSALHPDLPIETLARRAERHWELFQGLQPDDLVAVPLHARKEIVLAKISGRYGYEVGAGGEDLHSIGVEWYNVRIPLVRMGKHKPLFENYRERLIEVIDVDARNSLRKWLPHSYNRFARWKWLLVLLFALQIISMLLQK